MIRAEIVEGAGHWQLTIQGHAEPSVCAAITAIQQSMAILLEQYQLLAPDAVTFHYQETTP
jgi:hypothetical protein